MPSMTFRSSAYNLSGIACIAVLIFASGCRQQMANQPRYDTLAKSTFFANMMSARPLPEGVIARSPADPDNFPDNINGRPVDSLPFPVTMDVLSRGQQRYNIFCSPCHDFVGTGDGMATRRGFRRPPPSFHSERMRSVPAGYFFDVITNGFGAMPQYATVIPARDRWAIIAYIRALQLSQWAPLDDVPADVRSNLESQQR